MRTCGECTACCTALAVQELDKPRYERCVQLCESGCAAYGDRPRSCRDYQCLWLQGFLGEADRPDHLGVIFSVTRNPEREQDGNVPMLIECVEGALRQPRVRAAIGKFMEQKPVVMMTASGTSVLQPVQVTIEGRNTLSSAA